MHVFRRLAKVVGKFPGTERAEKEADNFIITLEFIKGTYMGGMSWARKGHEYLPPCGQALRGYIGQGRMDRDLGAKGTPGKGKTPIMFPPEKQQPIPETSTSQLPVGYKREVDQIVSKVIFVKQFLFCP